MLHDPDQEAANDVDEHDDDAGDRVPANKLGRSVHRPVEIRLLLDLLAAAFGIGFADEACVQIGVNRHLFSGQRIQRKPRANFRDTPCALGNDREVDDGQDDENDDPDNVVAADQKLTKSLDDLTGGVGPGVALE